MQQKDISVDELYVHRSGEIVKVVEKHVPLDRNLAERPIRNGVRVVWVSGWNSLGHTGSPVVRANDLIRVARPGEMERRIEATEEKHRVLMLYGRVAEVAGPPLNVSRTMYRDGKVGIEFIGTLEELEPLVKALEQNLNFPGKVHQ